MSREKDVGGKVFGYATADVIPGRLETDAKERIS